MWFRSARSSDAARVPSARGLPALAGFEVDEHPTGNEVGVGVEIHAAAARHTGGHRTGQQESHQRFESQVLHGDWVGDLITVGQPSRSCAPLLGPRRITPECPIDGARYSSTSKASGVADPSDHWSL